MRTKLASIIGIIFTLAAAHVWADSSPDQFGKRYARIRDVSPAVKQLPGWNRNMTATIELYLPYSDRNQDECTATQISKDGHFLLDLHCLTHCLKIQPENLAGADSSVTSPPVFYRFDRSLLGHKCDVSFKSGGPISSASIVALGRGYINFLSVKSGFKINREQFSSWIGINPNESDYAVLQVKGLRSKDCAPLSKAPLAVDEKVWTLSFPGKTTRKDGSKLPGEEKLFTSGYVRDFNGSPQSVPQEKSSCSSDEALPPNFNRGFFSSSLDVAPGASGSPVFDEEGKIMGLIHGESLPVDVNCNPICKAVDCPYRDGMALGIDIQTVVDNIRQNFGDQVVNESFNCQ